MPAYMVFAMIAATYIVGAVMVARTVWFDGDKRPKTWVTVHCDTRRTAIIFVLLWPGTIPAALITGKWTFDEDDES